MTRARPARCGRGSRRRPRARPRAVSSARVRPRAWRRPCRRGGGVRRSGARGRPWQRRIRSRSGRRHGQPGPVGTQRSSDADRLPKRDRCSRGAALPGGPLQPTRGRAEPDAERSQYQGQCYHGASPPSTHRGVLRGAGQGVSSVEVTALSATPSDEAMSAASRSDAAPRASCIAERLGFAAGGGRVAMGSSAVPGGPSACARGGQDGQHGGVGVDGHWPGRVYGGARCPRIPRARPSPGVRALPDGPRGQPLWSVYAGHPMSS